MVESPITVGIDFPKLKFATNPAKIITLIKPTTTNPTTNAVSEAKKFPIKFFITKLFFKVSQIQRYYI
jgi:hypothetical protein